MIGKIYSALVCRLKSFYYTLLYVDGPGKIRFTSCDVKLKIRKAKGAKLCINGKLSIASHIGGNNQTCIILNRFADLTILSDFVIGNGVTIYLSKDACLSIGGKQKESSSGVTSNSTIMVNKKISIGTDFLCAWDVFISDSDWHTIEGQNHQADVLIGDHVWVAHKTSILKGTKIGTNCIVASHSKLGNKQFPSDVLIGGTPAKILKTEIVWNRDLK